MSRKRKHGLILIAILAGGISLSVARQRIEAGKRQREAHFISIHFLCVNALATEDPEQPERLDTLLAPYGGSESGLLDPFPDGLILEMDGGAFQLEEPRPRRLSLFRSDRLVATNRRWPRWEASGEPARKFPGHEVPPPGYE